MDAVLRGLCSVAAANGTHMVARMFDLAVRALSRVDMTTLEI
jgi:hypothetical protein